VPIFRAQLLSGDNFSGALLNGNAYFLIQSPASIRDIGKVAGGSADAFCKRLALLWRHFKEVFSEFHGRTIHHLV